MTSAGPQVDDIIGRLDHIHVVLDDYDCVPSIDKTVQAVEKAPDVREVQTCRGLVQDVDIVPAALDLAQLVRQFHPLSFAAGQVCRRMT